MVCSPRSGISCTWNDRHLEYTHIRILSTSSLFGRTKHNDQSPANRDCMRNHSICDHQRIDCTAGTDCCTLCSEARLHRTIGIFQSSRTCNPKSILCSLSQCMLNNSQSNPSMDCNIHRASGSRLGTFRTHSTCIWYGLRQT